MTPSPTRPKGWTGPIFGASMKFPVKTNTLDDWVRCLAEEIRGVGKLRFEADDRAERAGGDSVIHVFVFAVGDLRTPRIAAEVVSNERADKSLGVCFFNADGSKQRYEEREQQALSGGKCIDHCVISGKSPNHELQSSILYADDEAIGATQKRKCSRGFARQKPVAVEGGSFGPGCSRVQKGPGLQ